MASPSRLVIGLINNNASQHWLSSAVVVTGLSDVVLEIFDRPIKTGQSRGLGYRNGEPVMTRHERGAWGLNGHARKEGWGNKGPSPSNSCQAGYDLTWWRPLI